ncbi:MAG: class I SAM-dependent methyltransferase [Acidobacteria bacterium]|nr:class I SAM-dependent methyltransferase [Acidobacteriota bacterium]
MAERRRSVSVDDLARLKREREEADERYNAALTALDNAIHAVPELPHPPPDPDETLVTPINTRWEILKARPVSPAGWRGRVAAFVWELIEPTFAAQQSFNAALVDHLNRNIAAQREIPKSIASTLALLRQQLDLMLYFQSFLQQMTSYVDTKDHEFTGLGRRVIEDAQEEVERLDRMTRGLAAGLSGVSDEMLKRWESLLARDQRYSGRIDEIRSSLAVAQQQVAALKREFERPRAVASTATVPSEGQVIRREDEAASTSSWKYVGFEDLFRGSRDEIRARQEGYVPLFAGASDVIDVGCGRGEFLDLLTASGIGARGLDLNHEMVELCQARGLDVAEGDAVSYLRVQPDASLGGLIAAQVVEHLEPQYLLQFLEQAQRTLRPGATIVLETINVACWLAFFESYIRDITHARALHPATLKYLVTASGFVDAEVQFKEPVDPANRLQPVPRAVRQGGDDILGALADSIDGNVERLNRLMFTHLDYAVVAKRP